MNTFRDIQEVMSVGRLPVNSLVNADCLEAMKYIEDKSIDMVLCDLPYGTTACKWDTIIPFEPLWKQYRRLIKDNGAIVLTASQPFTSALVMSNPGWFRCEWIWEKSMPNNFCQAAYQPMKYHENVLVFAGSRTAFNPILEERSDIGKDRLKNSGKILDGSNNTSNFMNFKRGKGIYREYSQTKVNPKSVQKINSVPNCNGTKLHPTQKPVALFEYLIKTYTSVQDVILDNCAGSFTTAVAADNTKRNWICIEKEKSYCDIGLKRINENRERLNYDLLGGFNLPIVVKYISA